jgi:MinD-like ATPase involved in chromosome partitioning or flagellar assembly
VTTSGPLPTVLATGGAAWEPDLMGRLAGRPEITVVRRCVDLADLLATAGAGIARAALVADSLHRLDRDTVARLRRDGVAVVGLADPAEDDRTARRLTSIGVERVLSATAPVADVVAALTTAVADARPAHHLDPLVESADLGPPIDSVRPTEPGRVIAIWGPAGAGRTTLAVNLAAELAAAGISTMLADADTYGACVAQTLGLLDEAPGLAAAARAANQGTLDIAGLARHARQVGPQLRVLTGLPRADRWPELRPAGLGQVWTLARSLVAITVVDCGFSLEEHEEIVFDVAAPRRNAATTVSLEHADTVIAVGAAGPVGVQRLVRGLQELREVIPGVDVRVVVNRVRRSVGGSDGRHGPAAVLRRHAGVERMWSVPDNVDAVDAALMAGRPLIDVAPRSPARQAIRAMASELGAPATATRGRARHGLGRR